MENRTKKGRKLGFQRNYITRGSKRSETGAKKGSHSIQFRHQREVAEVGKVRGGGHVNRTLSDVLKSKTSKWSELLRRGDCVQGSQKKGGRGLSDC